MKAHYFLSGCLILVAPSCSYDDLAKVTNDGNLLASAPTTPASSKFDIDGDSVDDFTINYPLMIWDGVNSSGYAFVGKFQPLGSNLTLNKRDANLMIVPLFNQVGDRVDKDVSAPLEWNHYDVEVVSIVSSKYAWPTEWSVKSNTIQAAYYIGIKIETANGFEIGWVKLTINKTTGEIKIVDQEITTANSVIITR